MCLHSNLVISNNPLKILKNHPVLYAFQTITIFGLGILTFDDNKRTELFQSNSL